MTAPTGVHQEVDVAAIRDSINMTQLQFSKAFGISLSTLRNWEQGIRKPHGPANLLLLLIKKDPEGIKQRINQIGKDHEQENR